MVSLLYKGFYIVILQQTTSTNLHTKNTIEVYHWNIVYSDCALSPLCTVVIPNYVLGLKNECLLDFVAQSTCS